jgi:putative phosphoesterase
MKILVVSDNHGKITNMNIVEKMEYDHLIHLGDSELNHDFIASRGYLSIIGNCDYDPKYDSEKIVQFDNCNIFLTHGHLRNIRKTSDLEQIEELKKYDIVMFGHLHIPYLKQVDKTIYMSPGSIEYPRGDFIYPTFAEITIINNKIKIEYFTIQSGKIKRMEL